MTAKYFAYGSNLDLLQMKRRCPLSKLISKGMLPDYRLTFNRYAPGWGGGVADVIQDVDSEVWGLIFEISDSDLERLDHYEGCYKDQTSLYERWKTVIDTPNGQVDDVWVYTVVEKQKFVQPTLEYLHIIKDAAVRWDFPKNYLQSLEKFQNLIDELREAVYGPHACINPKCKGELEHYKKNREFYRKMKKLQERRKEELENA